MRLHMTARDLAALATRYPLIRPPPSFGHSPGDAAQRAVIREGHRLTDSRIAIFEAPEREPGRQQVRREARKEAKRRLGPPATVAARQLRFYKAGMRAQQAA